MLVDWILPAIVGTVRLRLSPLHAIVPPLKLLAPIKVRVALMKEPLLKVTCATMGKESSKRLVIVPTALLSSKRKFLSCPVLVRISQLRNGDPLLHQNTTTSLGHIAVLLST